MNNQPFLFISSPFRSGSALLSRTLNAHSQIALINDDLKYFRFYYNQYHPLNEKNIRKILDDAAHRLLNRFKIKINVQTCLDEILLQQPINDSSIYSVLLNHLLTSHNKQLIGEMESVSWTKIAVFLNMFPESKSLLIIRDFIKV